MPIPRLHHTKNIHRTTHWRVHIFDPKRCQTVQGNPATSYGPTQTIRWMKQKPIATLPGDHLTVNIGYKHKALLQQGQRYSPCMDTNSGKKANSCQRLSSYVHTRNIYGAPWRRHKRKSVRTPRKNTVQSQPTESRCHSAIHTRHTNHNTKHQPIPAINLQLPSTSAYQQPTTLDHCSQTGIRPQSTIDQLREQETKGKQQNR